jgi:expansin (peptidoglycan-binding protein)
MNWKGFGRKRLWPSRDTLPEFAPEEVKKTTEGIRIVGVLADIRIKVWSLTAMPFEGKFCVSLQMQNALWWAAYRDTTSCMHMLVH